MGVFHYMSEKNIVHMGRDQKVDNLVKEWDRTVGNIRAENRKKYNERFSSATGIHLGTKALNSRRLS